MAFISDTFNNREIAAILWLSAFIIWAFSHKPIRDSVKGLIEILFSPKIIVPVILMFAYISAIVFAFRKMGLWDASNLKDTILWSFSAAFVMMMNINKVNQEQDFFSKVVLDNLKLILILEFVINLYVFAFWIELISVPIITIAVTSRNVAEKDSKYERVVKLLDRITIIYGLVVIAFSVYNLVTDFADFTTFQNLRSFLLPPVLTVIFLPFVYMMALYSQYELIFVRLKIVNGENGLLKYARRKILMTFHLNLRRLNRWSREVGVLKVSNEADVIKLLSRHKSELA